MDNPWLQISLADYEGHMSSAAVQQLQSLSDLFAEALAWRKPASVAILGVAGGNGLEHIDSAITRRTVGIDFNPSYLDEVRRRFGQLAGLELHCADLSAQRLALQPVDLVHVALVFEHAGVGACFENALSLVAESGAISVVLQLPGDPGQDVGSSGVASIQKLASHFALVDPQQFREKMKERGFAMAQETRRSLPAGKQFWMGLFVRG